MMATSAFGKAASITPTMRVTRGRTGKLPTPTTRKGFVTEFEDNESPPPSPSGKKLPRATEEPAAVPDEVFDVVPYKETAPLFGSFKTKQKLTDGLCIIRSLGGGRYEVVPLKDIEPEVASAEENGALIKGNEALRSMLSIGEEEWARAKFSCAQAIRSADKSIFRINKLPLELRLMIYEYAMISARPLHHIAEGTTSRTLGLNLMATSKAMLKETRPIFYKNSFDIDSVAKITQDHLVAIRDHLREATFVWRNFLRSDLRLLNFLDTCPNFKVLNMTVTNWCRARRHPELWGPDEQPHLKKFRFCNGYNRIIDLRGLEKVRVKSTASALEITDSEVQALQKHLNETLTKPVYVRPLKKVKVVAAPKAKKSKKTKKKKNGWDDDSEYDG